MADTTPLSFDVYEPLLGSTFKAVFSDAEIDLILVEAKLKTDDSVMHSFMLIFEGDPKYQFPQHNYTLRHEKLGEIVVFLVPLGPKEGAFQLQAIFSVLKDQSYPEGKLSPQ